MLVVLFVVVPAMTLAMFDGGTAGHVGVWILLGVLGIALLDLWLSRKILTTLECEFPELLRSIRGRTLPVPVKFINRGGELKWIRYGLSMSRFFQCEGEVIGRIHHFEAGKIRTIQYPLRPLKRGQYFLESFHVESPARLGLWLMRRHYEMPVEVRVYPDLSVERKRLSSVFLMRGNEGLHSVRQVGKGREFEQLRDYQHGDDYIDIDWKATARRQKPVTRMYQIERTQEVYVIVDHSRLSGRELRVPLEKGEEANREEGSGGEFMVTTQLERFLHCSLILSSVAERQGDLFGFISFADQIDRFIRSRNGRGHYNIVRDALYTLEPREVAPDFEQLMICLRQRLTRRALLVMLVDLSDPLTSEHFYGALPLVSRQHLILVNMVRPEKAHPLFSGKSDPETAQDVYDSLGGHFQWQELRETGKLLSHLGVELGVPDHEELSAEVVTQYLNVKKRQLL